jgi:hypothetical protein
MYMSVVALKIQLNESIDLAECMYNCIYMSFALRFPYNVKPCLLLCTEVKIENVYMNESTYLYYKYNYKLIGGSVKIVCILLAANWIFGEFLFVKIENAH